MTEPDPHPGPDERSMRERMLAGEPYKPDAELGGMARRARRLSDEYNATAADDDARRTDLLTELLGRLGTDTVVNPPLRVDYGTHLEIGDHGFVNFGLVALDCAPITIGEHVQIGPNVQLLTPTHPVEPDARRDKWEGAQPITIGDNVWLGGGVIVCPGVTIGDDTVVGAGSVVVKDLPAGVVAVGNPARVVKRVTD